MDELTAFNMILAVFGDEVFVVKWDDAWFVEYVPPEEERDDD